MNSVPTPSKTSEGSGGFAAGQAACKPGTGTGAGGVNLKKPFPTVGEGGALNKGRLAGGTERNYNGRGPVPLSFGQGGPSSGRG